MVDSALNKASSIFDAHVHIFPPGRLAGLMRWVHGFLPNHPVPLDVDSDGIISDMKDFRTTYFFNIVYPLSPKETHALNEFNFKFVSSLPNAFGWGSVHAENDDIIAIVETAIKEYGFIGMKLHPFVQRFSILDPRLEPLYETLNEMGRPLFIHTGFDDFYNASQPPDHVSEIASKFPRMPIILSHMFFPHLKETLELMDEHPQLIADLTNVPGSIRYTHNGDSTHLNEMPEAQLLRDGVSKWGDRFLFGTDHPAGVGGYQQIYSDFFDIGFSDNQVADITWNNPWRLVEKHLGIKPGN